jgi:nickel/cobalt transporter (NicO) family protein
MDLLVALPAAVGLGALHFLEPGHGKGVMTAYLVSSRARLRDAILLSFTSAISHTLSILFLAFLATSALQFMLPHQIEGWLGLISGMVITVIGSRMVLQRIFPPVVSLGSLGSWEQSYVCSHGHVHHVHGPSCDHDHHDHHHHHHDHHDHHVHHDHHDHHHHGHHHHDHGHAHAVALRGSTVEKRRLLSIGVLAGLIPCPSSLVMLLAAISAGQVTYGVGLVIAFSLGGALALSLLGILLLKAESKVRHLERRRFGDLMSTVSAMIIVGLGFLVTYESLIKLGWA